MSLILYSCINFTSTANASSSGILNTTQAKVRTTHSVCLTLQQWLLIKHTIFVTLQSHIPNLFNFALKCFIKKVKKYQKGTVLTSTDHLSVCMDAAHLLSKNKSTGKKSKEICSQQSWD
jgi:hypothetical protein